MPSLFVIQGRDQGRRFELSVPVITLGRDRSNDIQLHDTEVSRRHAEFRQENDEYALVDTQSSNGTFVNQQRIERSALKSGDRLQVAVVERVWRDRADPADRGPGDALAPPRPRRFRTRPGS